MHYPNLSEEKKLWRKGYKNVICLDEAGCGPLAGPVTAAAVTIIGNFCSANAGNRLKIEDFKEVRDSKKLSAKKREKLYEILTEHSAIKWGIGVVSEKIIDKINIKNAAELAMEKALHSLKSKIKNSRSANTGKKSKKYFLIFDGNRLKNNKLKKIEHKLIVKADEKVLSCAMASIIAKVTRDRIMMKYHKNYPKYHFDLNKGYPVKKHLLMLKKYGPCRIHRRSFWPVISCQSK